jgi:hypothetical protein
VVDVIVGGTVAVRERNLVGVDVPALLREAREVAAQAMADAGLASDVGSPWAQA